MIELIALWYLAGLIGAALVWFERTCQKWLRPELTFLCPSPKVIVLSMFGALFGPILLLVGILVAATSSDIGKNSWWNKPICKSDH